MKRYVELAPNATATHLKIEVYYNKGGLGFASYTPETRGYYLSVVPVTRENKYGCMMESFTAFSGIKKLVKPANRRSTKAETQAEENAQNYIHDLVVYVCNKNGLQTPAEFITTEV